MSRQEIGAKRRPRARWWRTAAAFLTAVAALGGVAPGAPAKPLTQSCGYVKGAVWHQAGKTGTRYAVLGAAGQCGTAKQWVPRLTRLSVARLLKAGPSGYHCGAATGAHNSWIGGCLKGKAFAFSWGPR